MAAATVFTSEDFVHLDQHLVDPARVRGQCLQGRQIEVDVRGVTGERRVHEAGHSEDGLVDGELLAHLDAVGAGVGGVHQDLVGRLGAEPLPRHHLGGRDQPGRVVRRVDPGHGVALGLGVGGGRVEHPGDGLLGHDDLRLVLLVGGRQALGECGAEGRTPEAAEPPPPPPRSASRGGFCPARHAAGTVVSVVAPGVVVVVVPVPKAPDASMQARTAALWAAVNGGGFCTLVIVWPPVVTVSVSLGTVPVSWSAWSDRPGTAEATPFTLATSDTATLGKVMRVPGTKKS